MRISSIGTSRILFRATAIALASAVAVGSVSDLTALAAKKNKKEKKQDTEVVEVVTPEEPEDRLVMLKSVNDAFTAMTVDFLVDGTEEVTDIISLMSNKLKLQTEDEFGNKYTKRQRKWLKKAMVSGDCVEVYEHNSKKSDVVGYMYSTSVATVLSTDDNWTYIKSGNVKGYVKTKKCIFGVAAMENCRNVETEVATVVVGAVNIRCKAEVNTKIIASAKQGDEFLYYDTIDNWAHILTAAGMDGYIDGAYVTIGSNIGTAYTVEEAEAGRVFTKEEVEKKRAEDAKKAEMPKLTDEEKLAEAAEKAEKAKVSLEERKASQTDLLSEQKKVELEESDADSEDADSEEDASEDTDSDDVSNDDSEKNPDLEITTEIIMVEHDPIEIELDELTLLAALIQCEAGGEPYIGQVAVGAVVLNRMRSGSFPDDITGVIYDEGQFSPVDNGMLAARLEEGNILQSCYDAAEEALSGVDPTDECLFFQRSGRRSGLVIGNHVFFKVF